MAERAGQGRRILFAPAAGAEIGGGHVMRCLSMASALADRDCDCVLAAPAWAAPIIAKFATQPFQHILLEDRAGLAAIALEESADAVVIDDYGMAAEDEAGVRGAVRAMMVIDDLADRRHLADLLLDPSYGRLAGDYASLLPKGAGLLLGPSYALLRPGFAGRRARAGDPVQRLFVSFGLSDIGGVAGEATRRLVALAPAAEIDVALSSTAESLPMLQVFAAQHSQVRVHVDHADVARLMGRADLAIGAGGVGVWERACLGLPSLALIVADNQAEPIARLGSVGAVLSVDHRRVGWTAPFDEAVARLLADADLRRAIAAKALTLCDGRGAERAADALIERLSR